MSVLIKICGLTDPADAATAAAAGADYVGVILVPRRLRGRTVSQAAAIFGEAAGARRVGVFADAPSHAVLSASAVLALDVAQLHGSESPAMLAELRAGGGPQLWKAVRADSGAAVLAAVQDYAGVADALLLDGGRGGQGVRFDWNEFRPLRSQLPPGLALVVAGGLSPATVGEAIVALQPDVVDVSSGVESAPGRKSAELIHAFVIAARGAGVA